MVSNFVRDSPFLLFLATSLMVGFSPLLHWIIISMNIFHNEGWPLKAKRVCTTSSLTFCSQWEEDMGESLTHSLTGEDVSVSVSSN